MGSFFFFQNHCGCLNVCLTRCLSKFSQFSLKKKTHIKLVRVSKYWLNHLHANSILTCDLFQASLSYLSPPHLGHCLSFLSFASSLVTPLLGQYQQYQYFIPRHFSAQLGINAKCLLHQTGINAPAHLQKQSGGKKRRQTSHIHPLTFPKLLRIVLAPIILKLLPHWLILYHDPILVCISELLFHL